MIVLIVSGPLGQEKIIEDFRIKRVEKIHQVLGLNVMMILKIEPTDDERFIFDVLSRIKCRFFNANIYDEKSGSIQPFEPLTPEALRSYMEHNNGR